MASTKKSAPTDLVTALSGSLAELAAKEQKVKEDAVWGSIDVEIDRDGKKIILPKDPTEMSYQRAIDTLKRKQEEENIVYDVAEWVPGGWDDALYALFRAMQDQFGFAGSKGRKGMFGIKLPPELKNIKLSHRPGDVAQVPFGDFDVPGIEHQISVKMSFKEGTPGIFVIGSCRRVEKMVLLDLVNRTNEILRDHSIYRGRAIRMRVDSDGDLDWNYGPEFMDLDHVSENDIIFPEAVSNMIQTNLLAPIKHTQTCRDNRIPLKRGILLEGPYGCGKSLTATVTAKVAQENGWTFITIDRSQGLKNAIEFAKLYQPCVIFAEDIDRAADREDESVNDLVNLLDGVLSKNFEIMVALTTNFVEKIDKSLLRPGRFDAVIRLEAPDAGAVSRLITHYAGPLLDETTDLTNVSAELEGQIPATIREVVERAKLSMIVEGRNGLTSYDLETSAYGMTRHLDLLKDGEPEQSAGDKLADALNEVLFGDAEADEQELKLLKQIQRHSHAAAISASGANSKAEDLQESAANISKKADKALEDLDEIKDAV